MGETEHEGVPQAIMDQLWPKGVNYWSYWAVATHEQRQQMHRVEMERQRGAAIEAGARQLSLRTEYAEDGPTDDALTEADLETLRIHAHREAVRAHEEASKNEAQNAQASREGEKETT